MAVELFGDEDTYVKVYDPSETGKVIGNYRNYKDAANKLACYSPQKVFEACSRKGRTFSKNLDKMVAPRLAKLDPTVKFTQ